MAKICPVLLNELLELVQYVRAGPSQHCGCAGAPCQCWSRHSLEAWTSSIMDEAHDVLSKVNRK